MVWERREEERRGRKKIVLNTVISFTKKYHNQHKTIMSSIRYL